MGRGQPDMQRKRARFGSKPDEDEDAGGPQDAPVLQSSGGRPHGLELQGTQLEIEEK